MSFPLGAKKDDDESGQYSGLDKGVLLQEARVFNEVPLNKGKCEKLLTKILLLLWQGFALTDAESTDLYFGLTKLFQSDDVRLRNMVYVVVKELAPKASEKFVLTAPLHKDLTSREESFRANALRTISRVVDLEAVASDRSFAQSMVDRNPHVASCAIVSALHLTGNNGTVLGKWLEQANAAALRDDKRETILQYHALALLYEMKKSDPLAVSKLVVDFARPGRVRSRLAHCLLIRYAAKVLSDVRVGSDVARQLNEYLVKCLQHSSEMVSYEAARSICLMKGVRERDLALAIATLQGMLSSVKPTIRFASVRTLNSIASRYPLAVVACKVDLEEMISDANRSTATLAITTLLKTGSEYNVDRLMKQVTQFMSDIADEFKIVVIESIRVLALRFPRKHPLMLGFLSTMLRDEGGHEYKRCVVDAVLTIVKEVPESREAALLHLCEFIEDCEFVLLSTRILHLLGEEAPKTRKPERYIRYIYNRVILEDCAVRAAAVATIAKIGLELPRLRDEMTVLLKRARVDADDEVRDRVTMYLKLLDNEAVDGMETTRRLVTEPVGKPLALGNLQHSLLNYLKNPTSVAFDLAEFEEATAAEVPTPSKPPGGRVAGLTPELSPAVPQPVAAGEASGDGVSPAYEAFSSYVKQSSVPLGKLFKTCDAQTLSAEDILVSVTKYVFAQHVLFGFEVTNTLTDSVLENVHCTMDPEDGAEGAAFRTIHASMYPSLRPSDEGQGPGFLFVLMERVGAEFSFCSFECKTRFLLKDLATGVRQGTEEEWELNDVSITVSDFVKASLSSVGEFEEKWDEVGGQKNEDGATFQLGNVSSIQDAVTALDGLLSFYSCSRLNTPVQKNATHHSLLFSGSFVDASDDKPLVLVRARLALVQSGGVMLELKVRSTTDVARQAIMDAVLYDSG